MTVEGEVQRAEGHRRRPPPALAAVGMFILGTVVAVSAAWVSRAVWHIGSLAVPWGLALAALSAAALVVLGASLGRGPAFAAVVGWATGVVLWLVRPGEAVIASDTLGYSFLVVPSVVLLVTAALTAPRPQEPSR